jgi:uncharacterized membrane-anchored protein
MDRRAHQVPNNHPQRIELANEIHARPPEALETPERITYVAVMVTREEREGERAHLAALCAHFGTPPPPQNVDHFSADVGRLRIKWERHTEFTGYGFYVQGLGPNEFDEPAITLLPDGWLAAIPGQTIAAAHVIVARIDDGGDGHVTTLGRYFPSSPVVGAEIGDSAGYAFTDFRIYEDGYERLLVLDRRLAPRQAGRMAKALFEIEAYRVMALLGLPVAREQGPRAAEVEQALAALTDHIGHDRGGDEALLATLTNLAAQVERAIDASQYRFSASRAYYDLVCARIEELRERPLPGIQTIDEFMSKRLAPALATVGSVSQRLRDLAERVARASNLLSTRVEIAREKQNQALLESMEARARMQLRLQETVEGLSIAAITYYGAGLVGYLANGISAWGYHIDHEIAAAVAIPIIAVLVLLALKRVRRKIGYHRQ